MAVVLDALWSVRRRICMVDLIIHVRVFVVFFFFWVMVCVMLLGLGRNVCGDCSCGG